MSIRSIWQDIIALELTFLFAIMQWAGVIDWEWWQIAVPIFVSLGYLVLDLVSGLILWIMDSR